ncbi:MAG: hypothetical protein HRT73_06865 [Flavobacteriales bacterium]|nr:hypothetical protein [Flavobacteriales bacterium]
MAVNGVSDIMIYNVCLIENKLSLVLLKTLRYKSKSNILCGLVQQEDLLLGDTRGKVHLFRDYENFEDGKVNEEFVKIHGVERVTSMAQLKDGSIMTTAKEGAI